MQTRIDFLRTSPKAVSAMQALQKYVNQSGLEHSLLHLVKFRASQLNGCGYCLDMHSKDALAEGENAQRLFLLGAWRETSLFSARERAALAWTEAVTLLTDQDVPDAVFALAREQFSETELVDLTLAVIAINGWNRLCVSFRPEVGNYRVAQHEAPRAEAAAT